MDRLRRAFLPSFACLAGLLLAGPVPPARGEEPGAPPPPFQPRRVETPIRLDGVLDEPAWADAPVIDDFVQQLPEDRVPPTERTEVRILYDSDHLYLGIRLFDREPDKIVAWTLQRDSFAISGDDQLAFCIDPANSGRDGFWFSTNPAGVRVDAQIFNEGNIFDDRWDGVWDVKTRVDEQGWVAEVELPLFNLRFSAAEENIMGLSFFRAIRRKNEENYSPYIPRNRPGTLALSLARKISLTGIRRGIQFQPKPYVLTRADRVAGPPADTDYVGRIGLDVLKWGVSSNLTLDLTYRTDFAQVEADIQQVNLTRFNLFYPEKRDFFLESAGLFQFGSPTDTDIFFSRRIGLSDEGEPIPILAGARLTGRMGKTSLGVLDVVTEDGGGDPKTNFAVVRVRRDILSRSSVGMIATDREAEGPGGGNRVVGGDAHFGFHDDWSSDFFYAESRSSPDQTDGAAWRFRLGREGDIWQYAVRHQRVDPGFDPGIGFVRRPDAEQSEALVAWKPRPDGGRVRQYALLYSPLIVYDRQGELESKNHYSEFRTHYQSGDEIGLSYEHPFERLTEDFVIFPGDEEDPADDIVVPPGDYPMDTAAAWFNTYQGRRVWVNVYGNGGTFYDGHRLMTLTELTAKFTPHFSVTSRYEWNRVRLPGGNFEVNLWATRLIGAINARLFGSALIQANDVTDDLDLNLRVDWIHHPGSDLFFVYNESRNLRAHEGEPASNGRNATFKLTWLFSF